MDSPASLLKIGKINHLPVVKQVDFGLFLNAGEDGDILLPARYVNEDYQIGDLVEVFVCYDSEDRLMATTETPKVMLEDFALLRVVSVSNVGAFLDWGLPKDLFLPFAEQTQELEVGQEVIVFPYLDKSWRISASMRLDRNKNKAEMKFVDGEEVSMLIAAKSDLGYKAILPGNHWGILYFNEVFQDLYYGQRIDGFIKKVRDDGKLDLALSNKTGHKAAEDIGPKILALLQQEGGFLRLNDKTTPEAIYKLFGVSKKKYKIALGGLYKNRQISVDDEGIRLLKAEAGPTVAAPKVKSPLPAKSIYKPMADSPIKPLRK